MFAYYDDFGYGSGWGCGRGSHHGDCHGGYGFGLGRSFGRLGGSPFGESDVEMLRRYRDRLELHKKEIEAEIKSVDEKISALEK